MVFSLMLNLPSDWVKLMWTIYECMWNPCNGKHSNENFVWNFSDSWTLLLLFVSFKNVQVNFTFSMPQFCLGVKSVRESVLLSGHWAERTASVIREPRVVTIRFPSLPIVYVAPEVLGDTLLRGLLDHFSLFRFVYFD